MGSNPVSHIEDISRYEDEEANYHLFKINIDGTGLTQLSHGRHSSQVLHAGDAAGEEQFLVGSACRIGGRDAEVAARRCSSRRTIRTMRRY